MQEALNVLRPKGNTKDDLKSAYRQACKKYHPDVNPNGLELMKLINAAHDFLKKHIKKWNYQNVNEDIPIDEVMQAIFDKIKRFPGIEIEVCGTWLWVSGDTKPYKGQLKESGLKWARKKGQWYWSPAGYRKKSRRVFTMDEIRRTFGSQELDTEPLTAVG